MATERHPDEMSETEIDALHHVELAVEWLRRAHGDLVAFHHEVGHAMDHLADAEDGLREAGRTELADELRNEYLPRGVLDDGRWSYDVLESYEDAFFDPLCAFEDETRDRLAAGRRHVAERAQEREWKRRAGTPD
jgi:hypothetical protein